MKVGDTLMCKCDNNIFDNIIHKNCIYKISRVFNDNKIVVAGIVFDTKDSILYYDKQTILNYIYNYFYTPEELRLKKLNSL